MATRLRKSYKFAFRSSLFISLFLLLVIGLLLWYTDSWSEYGIISIIFILTTFAVSFFVIQLRVEKFIYRRIKRIYDDVSLLETTEFPIGPVTTDMKTLTEEIEKFAKDKKVEIDTLKIREAYRRDFLGNVAHELKTPLFTVQGYILTLLDGAMEDKNVRRKYLQRAKKGVERLIYIVKDQQPPEMVGEAVPNLLHALFGIAIVIGSKAHLFGDLFNTVG